MAKNKALEQIEALAERLERARGIVEAGMVEPIEGMPGAYIVTNGEGKKYLVHDGRCTCPDYQHRQDIHRGYCKHRLAAYIFADQTQSHTESEILEQAA